MSRKTWVIISLGVLLIMLIGLYLSRYLYRPHILEVFVFNMASGRALFIRTPDDRRILVDSGGASEIIKDITSILPFYSRRIDAVFVTDANGKNMSGLVDIISRYSVARAYIPAISPVSAGIATTSDQIFEAFMQRAQIRHVPIVRVMAGDSIDVSPKIRISALFPAPQNLFTYSKSNMPEFDFTVTYGSTTFTYLGAATKKTQAFIASSTASLASPGAMGHIVLILSRAAAPDAMSAAFLAVSHFDEIVFSGSKIKKKAAAGSDSQAVSSPLRRVGKETAAVTNALQNIHLTNLRESGSLHVVSNGSAVVIEQWR